MALSCAAMCQLLLQMSPFQCCCCCCCRRRRLMLALLPLHRCCRAECGHCRRCTRSFQAGAAGCLLLPPSLQLAFRSQGHGQTYQSCTTFLCCATSLPPGHGQANHAGPEEDCNRRRDCRCERELQLQPGSAGVLLGLALACRQRARQGCTVPAGCSS